MCSCLLVPGAEACWEPAVSNLGDRVRVLSSGVLRAKNSLVRFWGVGRVQPELG